MKSPTKSPARRPRRRAAITAGEKGAMSHRERKLEKSDLVVLHTDAIREQVRIAACALRDDMPGTDKGIDIRAALEAVRHAE